MFDANLSTVRLQPGWFRPVVIAGALAVHGAVLGWMPAGSSVPIVAAPPLEVTIVPEGAPDREIAALGSLETDTTAPQPPDVTPEPPSPPPADAPTSEVPPTDPPPPEPVTRESPPDTSQAELPVTTTPTETPPTARPTLPVEPPKPRAEPRRREPVRPAPDVRNQERAREAERNAAESRRRQQVATLGARGVPDGGGGARQGGAIASGAYAAQVRSIIQARANGLGLREVEGVVGIAFTIGPSGRLSSHALSRPSGNAAIDRAVRGMLAGLSFPPPPGGSFSGNVAIRVR